MRFWPKIVRGIKTKKKVVALTFDDGPDEVYTIQVLEILAQFKATATFFVTGNKIKSKYNIVRKIIKQGHEIGNHGYSHRNLIFKSADFIREEIRKTEAELEKCEVGETSFFRPPYGRYGYNLLRVLKSEKKAMVLWNIPTKDYKAKTAQQIYDKVRKRLHPGGIIVLHDAGKANTAADRSISVEALKLILSEASKKGYKFCSISELLKFN